MTPKPLTQLQNAFNCMISINRIDQVKQMMTQYSSSQLFDEDEYLFARLICLDYEIASFAFNKRTKENNPINKKALLNCMYYGDPREFGDNIELFDVMFDSQTPIILFRLLIDVVGDEFIHDFDLNMTNQMDQCMTLSIADFVLLTDNLELHKFIIRNGFVSRQYY
jgi:hypothetical protein